MKQSTNVSIAIVGAGLAGTAAAVRLLGLLPPGSTITHLEKVVTQYAWGLAYSKDRTSKKHFLNLQAGRISMFRELRFDFINWANTSAARQQWPDTLQPGRSGNVEISTAIPRMMYQQYLKHNITEAIRKNHDLVKYNYLHGEVIDTYELGNKQALEVRLPNGEINKIEFDFVILATGNIFVETPIAFEARRDDPRVISDQYSPYARRILSNISPHKEVLIVGSGLRAYDILIDLQSRLGPHVDSPSKIVMISKHGLLHPVYPRLHEHAIVEVRRPPFLDEVNQEWSADHVERSVLEELQYQDQMLSIRADIDPAVRRERIVKGWERWVPELIAALKPEVIHELQRKHWSIITTARIGMVPEIGNIVAAFLARGLLVVERGTLHTLSENANGQLLATITQPLTGNQHTIVCDIIVSCLGREKDYSKVQNELWHSLVTQRRLASPHVKTRRGIETSLLGTVCGVDGFPHRRLEAAGVMREGDETQRNGRLGSFVFSIGPVRNNAHQSAVNILIKIVAGIKPVQAVERLISTAKHNEQDLIEKTIRLALVEANIDIPGITRRFRRWKAVCYIRLDPRKYRQYDDDFVIDTIAEDLRNLIDVDYSDTQLAALSKYLYVLAMILAVQDLCNVNKVTTTDLLDNAEAQAM